MVMQLLERYLQAVKFWLPKDQKEDIIAELSEDIHSQIDEKEAELGRKLNEVELEAILKQRGRPILVANRYLPQEHLIGPVLFPIYRLVLKIVAVCYLVPWTVAWLALLIFNSGYAAKSASHSWFEILGSWWAQLWGPAFLAAGTVTLVFAILERVQRKSHFLEEWDPRKLPPVNNPNVISRFNSIVELAANLFFCVWWTGHMSSGVVVNQVNLRIALAAAPWRYFFWGFLLIAFVNIGLALANLVRPYWTASRATIRLVTDMGGSVFFCWLLKANILVELSGASIPPEKAVQVTALLNLWMGRAFPIAVIVGVVIAVVNIFRIVRVAAPTAHVPGETAAMA
jgi:hypothetical protein